MAARGHLRAALALGLLAGCGTPGKGGGAPPAASSPASRPAWELALRGCSRASGATLREALSEELERLRSRPADRAALDDLAYEVERLYRERGFHFVRVAGELAPPGVVLRVEEGPRVLLARLAFPGARAIPPAELEGLLAARRTGILDLGERIFVAREAAALPGRIREKYLNAGFLEVQAPAPEITFTPDRTGAAVTVRVEEGRRHVVGRIDLPGDLPADLAEGLAARLAPLAGEPFNAFLPLKAANLAEEHLAERGYPEAKAEAEVAAARPGPDPSRAAVDLALAVAPGPFVRIGKVTVQGDSGTRRSFIRSRLALAAGDLYDSRKLRESFRALFRTGLFKAVKLRLAEPAAGAEGERDLMVEVEEGPTLEYFAEAGLGSYDLLRLKGGVREANLLGQGLIGRVEVLGSIRGAEITLGVTDPWFLRSPWVADLPVTLLRREEPSFTLQEETARLKLSRRLGQHLEGGAAYRFSLSELVDDKDGAGPDERDRLVLGALGPFLERDTRDGYFAPTRGTLTRVFLEAASPLLGGEIAFLHGGLSSSLYLEPLEGTVLAGRAATEWIRPVFGTTAIPIQERLFAGGENSVRSFGQSELGPQDARHKPLGGEVRNLLNVELRQRLAGELSLALFWDHGNVALRTGKPFTHFRSGIGLGLRYGLPIGPLRLDWGFNPDPRDGEDRWALHLAVGMPF